MRAYVRLEVWINLSRSVAAEEEHGECHSVTRCRQIRNVVINFQFMAVCIVDRSVASFTSILQLKKINKSPKAQVELWRVVLFELYVGHEQSRAESSSPN